MTGQTSKKSHILVALLIAAALLSLFSITACSHVNISAGQIAYTYDEKPDAANKPIPDFTKPNTVFYPGVPLELQQHVFLDYRGQGACRFLRGDVLLTVLFVSDGEGIWFESAREETRTEIESALQGLREEAEGYGVELNLSTLYLDATATQFLSWNNSYSWAEEAVASTGYDLVSVSETLKGEYGVDEAPIILFVNHPGRSFAISDYEPDYEEYAIIYEYPSDVCHELLHLFGANDYYVYDLYEQTAEKYFPDNIMLSGDNTFVDPLTAYVIGWTKDPTPEGIAFLTETADLTEEQRNEEYEQDTFTGYAEQYLGDGMYYGYLEDGIPHGTGRMEYDDGVVYDGDWAHGVFEGNGTLTWPEGDSYTGEFKDGYFHGKGTYRWSNGDRYIGHWSKGCFHGEGTYIWADGSRQAGEWENDEFVG